MDEFEQHLKTQPLRAVPSEWREDILSTAATSARGSGYVVPPLGGLGSSGASQPTPPAPWWHLWLWPSPYAWAALAFVWLIIFGLNAAAQPSRAEIEARGPAPAPKEIMAMLDEWRHIEDELTRPQATTPVAPALPPSPQRPAPGAYLEENKSKAGALA